MGKSNIAKAGWIAVAIIVVVVVISIIAFHAENNSAGDNANSDNSAPGQMPTLPDSPTHTAAPADVSAPNEGGANISANTAVPYVQAPASPGNTASFRSFSLKIDNNAYTPNTIIVNQGDTVNLVIAAVDGNYGFTQPDYGLSSTIAKGKTQTIQFQALESGKFTFYCATCGGPAKGPVGYLIVTAN